jgi:DNA adenine methylase
MAIIVPPIKSQGIKTKLVPWINNLVLRAGVNSHSRWIEPFFGTGVVGLNAPIVGEHIVGDINPYIINFYKAVYEGQITPYTMRAYLENANRLLSSADEDGYAYYREVKNRFNKNHELHDFIFLSRAGFNGMMRFNKKGEWNVPFCKKPERFAPAYITKICNQIANVQNVFKKSTWQFLNTSFLETIEQATENDLIYCDPPYFGRYTDYFTGWTEQDEENLFIALKNTRAKFILSTWHHNEFRMNEMMEKYWNVFNVETTEHFYHGGAHVENRHPMVEALFFNFEPQEQKAKIIAQRAIQIELFPACY